MVDNPRFEHLSSGRSRGGDGAERVTGIVRLAVAFVSTVLALLAFLLGRLTALGLAMVLFASAAVVAANVLRFQRLRKGRPRTRIGPHLLVSVDLLFIASVAWFCCGRSHGATPHLLLLGGSCVAIGLASLYRMPSTSLLAGGLAVAAYVLFQMLRVAQGLVPLLSALQELAIAASLIGLSAILARNMSGYLRSMVQSVASDTHRYHTLLAHLPEILYALDNHGRISWASEATETLFGVHPAHLYGRRIDEILELALDLTIPEQGISGTYRVREDVAEDMTVECRLWPARRGGDVAWEGYMTDVTDRERAVAQREEMMNRLFQYQKMESLGTLAGGMAHDFRNVLQTVSDAVESVIRDTGEAHTREEMTRATSALSDARFLVSELLSLGTKDALNYDAIDMRRFLEECVPALRERVGPQCEVLLTVGEGHLAVLGDHEHLRRVLLNLVSNARDAMEGKGSISIDCRRGDRSRNSASGETEQAVVLRVSDDGPGIPEELVRRIFDPFVSTKESGKGTGLGLALVQHLIILHHGTIDVEKTGPEGTVFRMTFPAADQLEIDNDTRWMQSTRQRTRVLLVDDDPKIREVLHVFLRDLKYDVGEAQNLVEAMADLRAHRDTCRVVVMDWKLNADSAEDVIRELRRIRPDLVTIVVSGYAPKEAKIRKLGIHRWFTKPYDKNLLDIEIQRALYLASRRPG